MNPGYRAYAQISLDALEKNYRGIRSVIGKNTALMCVIKTNAYGHGAVKLAQELERLGADAFAVATVEEAVELRDHGIKRPILVLGYISRDSYKTVVKKRITATIYSYTMVRELDRTANSLGMNVDVHIKIDTGMSRIGFKPCEDTVQELVILDKMLANTRIKGIFTHFACADKEDDELTMLQAKRFNKVIEGLHKQGIDIPCRHCSNSAAIMRYPDLNMNMVRAGIILYGLHPSGELPWDSFSLKPVMALKSLVVLLKTVPEGTTVGYGATYTCKRETTIATVAIGYGDGFPVAASNKARVLIGNQSFPIIGRVCMDQLMVDVTDAVEEVKKVKR